MRFRVVVEAARDTFSQNDRADANTIVKGEPRDRWSWRATRTSPPQLVAALETERQTVDTVDPGGAARRTSPGSPTTTRSSSSTCRGSASPTRQLAALQVYVRDLGRGLVDGRRAARLRRRRLHRTRRSRRRCRSTWASATGRSSRTSRSSSSSTSRARWTPATATPSTAGMGGGTGIAGVRKVDIGKEAILRAAAALTERDELGVVAFDEQAHWVVKTAPLGGIADLQGADRRDRADWARRTSSPASTRRCSRSRTRPPRGATSSC